MERIEFATWVSALQTYYPRHNLLPNTAAIELWWTELGDFSYGLLSAALRKWVNTERYPPSIAELREICSEIVHGKPMDWGEAWASVVSAIGRYGMYQEEKAISSLQPIVQQVVSRIGWRDICMSENPDTLRAQFRQVFQICQQREIEARQLPPALKETIANIGSFASPSLSSAHHNMPKKG